MPPTKKRKWEWNGEVLFLQKNIDVAEGLEGWGMTIGTAMCRLEEKILTEGKISSELASDILNLTGMKSEPRVLESIFNKLTNLEVPLCITNMKEALSKKLFPQPTKKALVAVSTTVNSMFYGQLRPENNSLKLSINKNRTNMCSIWLKKNIMNDPSLFSRLIRTLYIRRHTIDLYKQNQGTIPCHIIHTMLIDIFFKMSIHASVFNAHMNLLFFLVKHQWSFIKEWFVYLKNVFNKEISLGIFLNDLKCPALDLFSYSDRLDCLQNHTKYEDLSEGVEFIDQTSYLRQIMKAVSVIRDISENESVTIEEFLLKASDISKVKEEDIKKYTTMEPGPKKRKLNTDLLSRKKKKRKVDDNNNLGQLAKPSKKKKVDRFHLSQFVLSPNSVTKRGFSFSPAKNQSLFQLESGSKEISASTTTNFVAEKEKNRLSPVAEFIQTSPEMNFDQNDKDHVSPSPASNNFENLEGEASRFPTVSQPEKINDQITVSVSIENIANCSASEGKENELSQKMDCDQHNLPESSDENFASHSSLQNLIMISIQDYFDRIIATENIENGVSSLTLADKRKESSPKADCGQNAGLKDDGVLENFIDPQNVNKDVNTNINPIAPVVGESQFNLTSTAPPGSAMERMKELMEKLREKIQADLPNTP